MYNKNKVGEWVMKLKSDRKNYVIMALCVILLIMSGGYVAFSQLPRINGTACSTNYQPNATLS